MDEPLTEEGESVQAHPKRAAMIVAGAAVAVALLIVTLAPGTQTPGLPQISAPSIVDAAVESNGIGTVARLDFVLKDLNGVDVKLASFKGKVILLNFWATWCPPCRAEIPGLVELQQQHPDDLVILGMLTLDPMTRKTAPFASQLKMNYPILDANDRDDLEQAYGPFWGLPTSVVIGRDGRIAKKHQGLASKEQFDLEIRGLF
jgi:thiol-disulfide isomerase/thioredoxin